MSVSQATTSVRLSCACERRGRKPAAPIAATPTVPFRNDRRSMRGLMLALLSGSLLDRLRREEDVLRAFEVILVELTEQFLAGRGGQILLVLLHVADLDALDVVPARGLGAVDGPLDAMRGVAGDAWQRLRDPVVVLAQPSLVGGWVDPPLQRRDDVAHFHRRPPRLRRWLSSGDGFEAVQQVARLQHPVLLTGRAVDGDQPRVAGGPQRDEERLDRGARLQLDREAIAALRHEAAQVAVHVDRHRHSRSSARTRGMTSRAARRSSCTQTFSRATSATRAGSRPASRAAPYTVSFKNRTSGSASAPCMMAPSATRPATRQPAARCDAT